jgi:hypothetical protein
MNREQGITRFVRENLTALSDAEASKELVKHLRQDFFHKHNLPSGERFTGREVAETLCRTIAPTKRANSEDLVIQFLMSIPHVSDELGEAKVVELVKLDRLGGSSKLSAEDLSRIGKEDFLEELEKEFLQRAESDAERRLVDERRRLVETMNLLQAEHQALDAVRSRLESIPPDADLNLLIDKEPTQFVPTIATVWWKDLGLDSDPFASNRGLSGIPEAKYDDVVVKTPFFQSHLDSIEQRPESYFGKTIVVLGEFGSGKTTLFQILGSKAATKGILPIVTSLHPDVSVSRLTGQLVGQLQESLLQTFPGLVDAYTPTGIDSSDDIGRALHFLSEAIRRAPATRGFLLLVDGLHKTEMYLKQSLEFLSQLQTLQERFELRGVKLAVFVAGSTRWETELRANPSLSGSFYGIETIPPVSEDQAVESVIRRIRSFTPAGSSPPSIVRAPLRVAYQVLAKRILHPLTFRDYLDHVRDRFVAREYASLGVSLRLHRETIEHVKGRILTSPLAESYRDLSDPTRHSRRLKEGLRQVLPEICARKGIRESDPLFDRHVGIFALLSRMAWIVRRIDPSERKPTWHLAPGVVAFLQDVEKYSILPTDALEALFTDVTEVAPKESESIYGPLIRQLEGMVATWRSGLPEISALVERSLSRVKSIDKQCKSAGLSERVDLTADVRESAEGLLDAINFVALGRVEKNLASLDLLELLWCAPENLDAISQAVRRASIFDPAKPEGLGFLLGHSQALSDLCELLTALVRGEGVCRLAGRSLTPIESERFHTARTSFLNQQYQATVDQVSDIIEGKIRDCLFVAMRCAKGDKAPLFLPSDIRQRVKDPPRGHPRARRPSDRNFLYDISRSEYSKILFGGEVRSKLLREAVPGTETDSLRDSTELLFSLGDRDAHRDRPNYFREHATEIGTALQSAPRLCELLNILCRQLVVGDGFSVKKTDTAAEFLWGSESDGCECHRIGPATTQALVEALLDRLEGDSFLLPPLEPALLNIHVRPELGLCTVRAAAIQELIKIESSPYAFGFRVVIADRGKSRLIAIRRAMSQAGQSLTRDGQPT